jgi:2-polyprenyl-6-methoxyphenol hydroxylase-like FAD-dependent oxidoreductase
MRGPGPSRGDDVDSRHDVIVIGAGPAGEAAAELAGSFSCSVALVERDTAGGSVDAERRTSCPWVFAAGDVIGPSLASVATGQGRQALCGALGLDFSAHADQVPAASEIAGTGQAMIHNDATTEDVVRMAYNTPTYTYGYKLAAIDTLARLHPGVLQAMRLPSQADRI